MEDLENTLKQFSIHIEEKIQHTYIEKYIDKPLIDDIKLSLLLKLFQYAPINERLRKDYIVSTMLIQMAADTHELVPTINEIETSQEEKEKQLLVLAGDYYSGLHYLLLAKTADFAFIQLIATSVKKINELKTDLFYKERVNFAELLNDQKEIHSLITLKITEFYTNFSVQPFIADIILTNLLIEEKHSIIDYNQAKLLKKLEDETSLQGLIQQIDQAIDDHLLRIESYLNHPSMKDELKQLQFDHLFQRLKNKNYSFVEEG